MTYLILMRSMKWCTDIYICNLYIYTHTHTPLAEMHEDIDPDPWKETPGALLPACQCSVIC